MIFIYYNELKLNMPLIEKEKLLNLKDKPEKYNNIGINEHKKFLKLYQNNNIEEINKMTENNEWTIESIFFDNIKERDLVDMSYLYVREEDISMVNHKNIFKVKFPKSVNRIIFEYNFDEDISGFTFPENITEEINFGCKYSHNLDNITFPKSIKKIVITNYKKPLANLKINENTQLILQRPSEITINSLPSNLKYLFVTSPAFPLLHPPIGLINIITHNDCYGFKEKSKIPYGCNIRQNLI
jgi:hypothetical protein